MINEMVKSLVAGKKVVIGFNNEVKVEVVRSKVYTHVYMVIEDKQVVNELVYSQLKGYFLGVKEVKYFEFEGKKVNVEQIFNRDEALDILSDLVGIDDFEEISLYLEGQLEEEDKLSFDYIEGLAHFILDNTTIEEGRIVQQRLVTTRCLLGGRGRRIADTGTRASVRRISR
jgi:hypothetical protein